MRIVPRDRLAPGLVLAETVDLKVPGGPPGAVEAGSTLSPDTIERIRATGIPFVRVEDARFGEISLDLPVPAPLWDPLVGAAFAAYGAAERGESPTEALIAARDALVPLAEEIARRTDRVLTAPDPRPRADYLPRHGLRSALLCLLAANRLGWPVARMVSVGLAGLFADLGMTAVPEAIRLKPGPLDEEEWEIVRRHPRIGADRTGGVLPDEAVEAILKHQERLDGSGYPDRLPAERIPFMARLVAGADAYDAMTSLRPWRNPLLPHEALRGLAEGTEEERFSLAAGEALAQVAAPYPLGVWVRLNSGFVGMVAAVHDWALARPDIQVTGHFKRGPLREPFLVELCRMPGVSIRRAYPGDPWETGEENPFAGEEAPKRRRSAPPKDGRRRRRGRPRADERLREGDGPSSEAPEGIRAERPEEDLPEPEEAPRTTVPAKEGFAGGVTETPRWMSRFLPGGASEPAPSPRRRSRVRPRGGTDATEPAGTDEGRGATGDPRPGDPSAEEGSGKKGKSRRSGTAAGSASPEVPSGDAAKRGGPGASAGRSRRAKGDLPPSGGVAADG